jgi:hypothetical protein
MSGLKDFDIITNRYITEHVTKTKLDSEILLKEAAHKYWRRNKYNPITRVYVD